MYHDIMLFKTPTCNLGEKGNKAIPLSAQVVTPHDQLSNGYTPAAHTSLPRAQYTLILV